MPTFCHRNYIIYFIYKNIHTYTYTYILIHANQIRNELFYITPWFATVLDRFRIASTEAFKGAENNLVTLATNLLTRRVIFIIIHSIWIQSESGLPLDVSTKIQINMVLEDLTGITNAGKFADMYLPLLWFEIVSEVFLSSFLTVLFIIWQIINSTKIDIKIVKTISNFWQTISQFIYLKFMIFRRWIS